MDLKLGTCCACGGTEGVRNIYTLDKKCPTPGKGWGCFVCGLSADGAVAVVCDGCHEAKAALKFACDGLTGGRVAIETLSGYHAHDMSKHRAEEVGRQRAAAAMFN